MLPSLLQRSLSLDGKPPPAPRTRESNNPTLLFSWWCTGFAAVIIVIRLLGRKTRSNVLFREDWIMMLALVPLFARMAFIHVVLLYGTNNIQTIGHHYTDVQLEHRSTGARLVLAARIFYALFIWMSKLTVSEFLKRITIRIWRRSYEWALNGIRVFLVLTFFAVVIGTLSECQPFDHYWQVVPDPGPHCRLGYGNLITMGTCDIITDILLVAFPIPIVLRSGQTWKRKLQLASLFSLSLILIGVTAARVPEVIKARGSQQYRTIWASCEILASTAVSNAVILGAFLRDKGTKRNKYRSSSISDSIDRGSARRPTVTALQNTGSEEDLFRFLGIRVPEHLQEKTEDTPRPAPAALPAKHSHSMRGALPALRGLDLDETSPEPGSSSSSDDSLRKSPAPPSPPPSTTKKNVNFFDVGGLLEDGVEAIARHNIADGENDTRSHRSRGTSPVGSRHSGTVVQDFAPSTPAQSRRGSLAFLQDVGGLLTPTASRSSGMERYSGRRRSDSHIHPPSRPVRGPATGVLGPMLERRETQQSLQDAGGLLSLSDIPEGPGSRSASLRRTASEVPVPPRSANSRLESHPHFHQQATEEQTEDFHDIGGLLSERHEPDASAAALQRATSRPPPQSSSPAGPSSPPRDSVLPPTAEHAGVWDILDIHDPGGLAGK